MNYKRTVRDRGFGKRELIAWQLNLPEGKDRVAFAFQTISTTSVALSKAVAVDDVVRDADSRTKSNRLSEERAETIHRRKYPMWHGHG